MKKAILIVFFILLTTQAQALIILTNKTINFNTKSGTLKGNVVLGNKIQRAIAIGKYKVSSNGKDVVFNISSILKDDQTHNLSSEPSVIKNIKGNKILKKGSKLILAGENQEEIARIFGIPLTDYQKKSGTKATSSNANASNNSNTPGSNNSLGSSSSSGSTSGSSSGFTSSSSSGSNGGFTNSSGSDYGSGYIPNPSINDNNGTNYYPVPNGSFGNTNSGENNANDNEYSTQFCKSPSYTGKNSIGLSFIAKDGSCVDVNAQRDDTKCEYRYDFNDGVAIKQTQFYYVDNENQIKNVGGCVDLQGAEYRFPLYKDDSKCQLQVTTNKGYNGNQAYFFQTQILFRGADGLVHTAVDCSDYQNVQEELISYDKDTASKQVKRIVNQYYIDPKTGEKVYINNGIISPFKFPYQEYACGAWEFDDANLQAYRRTQIKAFDNVANKYIDITSCDYSNDEGKSGRITMPYIKLPNEEKAGGIEAGDMNGTYEFEFKQRVLNSSGEWTHQDCGWWGSGDYYYVRFYNGNLQTLAKWTTTYKTTNTGVTIGYQRPKQEDEKEPSIYYTSKRVKTIDRTTRVIQNDLNLDADYMKFYEVNENYYKDESIKLSTEFATFVSKYYKPKKGGLCLLYSFSNAIVKSPTGNCHTAWGTDNDYSCSSYNDYLLPTKK